MRGKDKVLEHLRNCGFNVDSMLIEFKFGGIRCDLTFDNYRIIVALNDNTYGFWIEEINMYVDEGAITNHYDISVDADLELASKLWNQALAIKQQKLDNIKKLQNSI